MTGIKLKANEGRDLTYEFNGKKFARYPVVTHFISIGEELKDVLDKYAKPDLEKGDTLCISSKIVSITTKGMAVHKDSVRITPLARLIVKFVKKWPNDIGYSSPRKMQLAINTAGYPRIVLALIVGILMKLIGKPGYFYRVAGNRINAIDGFTVGYTKKTLFADYAFLPPSEKQAEDICNFYEDRYGVNVVILDGNNIENNIMGMGDMAKKAFSKEDFMEIVSGNPQGQEDDETNSPLLIVREVR